MIARLFLLTALLLGLAGCSTFTLNGPTPSIAELDTWLDNNQYSRVLSALQHVPRDHPDYVHYTARRNAAETGAKRYEKSVLANVAKAEMKKDWAAGIALIDKALHNYPESLKLSEKRVALISRQQRRSKVLSAEALLARTAWLQSELPLREQKAKRSPVDISLQWSLGQVQNEIKTTVSKLIATATDLFEYNEVDLIDRCLSQARALKPGKIDLKTISLLEDRLAIRRDDIKRKKLAREAYESIKHSKKLKKSRKNRIRHLLKRTNAAIKKNNLILARKNIDKLNRIAADNPEVIRLDAYIHARIDALVKQMSEKGSMLYRQERIASAKKIWEEALALDPDNKKLSDNINRASRVLKKLQKLREQQAPG